MLAQQRRSLILGELRRAGAVKVGALTDRLGVSEMTIRRDLEQLSVEGLATKVHGGAVLPSRATFEPGFEAKSQLAESAKVAIASAAASLIRPGAAIALSAGTTTWAMAGAVAAMEDVTVITNSPTVADAITRDQNPRITVILTGGVRTPSAALVGPIAVRSIAGLHVDQLFLGVHGVDGVAGFTTPNLAEAETNQALIAAAAEVIVVADSSKWGVVGLADIAPLGAADVFITDAGISRAAQATLRESVGSLRIVDPSSDALPDD